MTEWGLDGSWRLARLGLLLAGALATLGCGANPADPNEPAISIDDVLVCTQGQTLPSGEVIEAEWYSTFAMNNKLKHFPDFAATTRLTSVTNCAEARELFDRYQEYQSAHPDFDANEPMEAYPRAPLTVPTYKEPEILEVDETSKIKNGQGDTLRAAVGISNYYRGTNQKAHGCTAWFIARNWLITAAHCLVTKPNYVPSPANETSTAIEDWYDYHLSFASAGGGVVAGDVRDFPDVRQYYDHRYVGFRAGYQSGWDFAMLFVWWDYDYQLPSPDRSDLTGQNSPFLRVSLRDQVDTSNATAWGFGAPDTSKLHRADLNYYTLTAGTDSDKGDYIKGDNPADSTQPFICGGDSGGPLVDRYDITDPTTMLSGPEFVGVAVTDAITPDDGTTDKCAVPSGQTWWTRTGAERNNISLWISQWYSGWHCTRSTSNGALAPDYMECFGQPCQASSECRSGQACLHPASELQHCPSIMCGVDPDGPNGATSCNCLRGQCFDTPAPLGTPPPLPPPPPAF